MDDKRDDDLKEAYPPNSRLRRQERPRQTEKKVEKVTTGVVRQQKRSFGKSILEFLFEEDTKSVGSYILHDVLLPAAKAMLSDAVNGGLDMWLFGERRGTRSRREGGRGYTSYGNYYRSDDRARDRDTRDRDRDRRDVSRAGRARHDFDEVVFETRGEAEDVRSRMVDLIQDFGLASVADFYELSGIENNYTDAKYGWDDLREMSGSTVSRIRSGYIINLPRPRPLD